MTWCISPRPRVIGRCPNNPAPASVCGSEVSGLGLSQSQLTKYGSDKSWNYELVAKTGWLDHRLKVNGSV